MSTLKVNAIRQTSATSDAVTLASDGTCTAKITNNLSNRNLVVNGSCLIAQRGVSSTTNGYGSVDRFKVNFGGTDENVTHEQVAVASGTTPYTSGFRKALKLTNGNQTSGAGSGDDVKIEYAIEAQDIANSGWNYISASSYITLSFWVKSSVAQNFYGYIQTFDGTGQRYAFETGSLSADTWTKVTKTIPGNSNITVNDDNGVGLKIVLSQFIGTDMTSSISLNTWGAFASGDRTPDQTSTWYTTNDATWELTGLQLEVSDHATDFEFKSYGDELLRCQRYYYAIDKNSFLFQYTSTHKRIELYLQPSMRATPSYDHTYPTGANITIDGASHQNEKFFCAYSPSAYDGANKFYESMKFSAEL